MLAEVTSPLKGEWMTPRRRFLSAIYRGHVDKIPACTLSSVVTVEMMDLVNAPFPEAHLDAEMMARLAATAHDVFGMDTIMPVFHSQLESDALGGETEWAEKDNWPSPSRFTIEEPDQVKIPDDFVKRPTMAAVTGAIKLLRQRYPDVAIVGKVYGPWSVGYQMVGIESFLMDVMLDPDKIKRYLDVIRAGLHRLGSRAVRGRVPMPSCGPTTRPATCAARRRIATSCSRCTSASRRRWAGRASSTAAARPSTGSHLFAAAGWDVFHFESQVDAREARDDGRRPDGPDGQPEQPDAALPGHAGGRLQGVLGPDGRGRRRAGAGRVRPAGHQEGAAAWRSPTRPATGRPCIAATTASSIGPTRRPARTPATRAAELTADAGERRAWRT